MAMRSERSEKMAVAWKETVCCGLVFLVVCLLIWRCDSEIMGCDGIVLT